MLCVGLGDPADPRVMESRLPGVDLGDSAADCQLCLLTVKDLQ